MIQFLILMHKKDFLVHDPGGVVQEIFSPVILLLFLRQIHRTLYQSKERRS